MVTAAFTGVVHSSQKESLPFEQLRECGALTLSLVAAVDNHNVGHLAFSPVTVDGRLCDWFALAPLAVLPAFQKMGVGWRLVKAGLQTLQTAGAEGCVLLGEPQYYRRFGFANRRKLILKNVPAPFFLARSFTGAYPSGEVRYHRLFDLCA